MENQISIKGKLVWGETGKPVAGASVELLGTEGAAVASAKSDDQGRYQVTLSEDMAGRPIHIVVGDGPRVLYAGRDTEVVLQGRSCEVESLIPGSGPVEADFVAPPDLAAEARDAADPEALLTVVRKLVAPRPLSRIRGENHPTATIEKSLCGTPVLEAIEETLRTKGWPSSVAAEVDDILALRASGFATATYLSPNFSITYQTSGTAAVPASTATEKVVDPGGAADLGTIGDGTTPTYILRVAFWLERALSAYISPPFSMLNPAAAGRIPVVINTAPYGSASPSGTFYLNNNLPADLICAVGVHELFHMVQFKYGTSTGPWRRSVIEGGAVFAEDSAADKMNRYLDEAGTNFNGVGTQSNPNLSLISAGYKCCLFWRYVAEQQSADITEPFVGVETYRNVLEHASSGTYSTGDVKAALRELPWYQDFYEMSYLDKARLDLTNSETALGNYALACYLKDLGTNEPDRRFEFMEDEENIYIDEVVGGPAASTLASPSLTATSTLLPTGSLSYTGNVNAFAHRYYQITVDPAVSNVMVQFTAGAGFTSLLCQIVLIDQDGKVRDIHRSDRTAYRKRVANLIAGKHLSKVLVVVTGATTPGSYSLTVSPAAPASDVMITRWHTVAGREYEIDSRNWAWTWVSPDVWVDNNSDGIADGTVYFNTDNKLHIRLHNKGNAAAAGIQIQAYYQDASPGLTDAAWKPVKSKGGTVQVLTGLTLAAGATNDWTMKWSPAPSGNSQHFCVRVVVTVPGDPNTDNKRCVSNFGSVQIAKKQVKDLRAIIERLYPHVWPISVQLIPRFGPRKDLKLLTRDLRELEAGRLGPATSVRLAHVPLDTPTLPVARFPGNQPVSRFPDALRSYGTDPRALPPGVANKPMITIAAVSKEGVVGGVTLMVEVEE